MNTRSEVVKLAQSWVGKKEKDGSYLSIINTYNNYKGPHPRGILMKPSWAWCACTWSALAIALGYTNISPIEISCGFLIEEAKKKGIWVENDGYIPSPGDAVLYDWDDNGKGDCTGWPDHVGTVEYVNKESGYFTVIEGNYSDSVKKRTVSFNGRYIRGFITPKYDKEDYINLGTIGTSKDPKVVAMEVIAGVWGNGEQRKKGLEANGHNYDEIQKLVMEILNGSAVKPSSPEQDQNQPTEKKVIASCAAKKFASNQAGTYETLGDPITYCRNDAGTNKKALCQIPKGTKVQCFGYYNEFSGTKWLYVQFAMDAVQYTGFVSSKCLKKV